MIIKKVRGASVKDRNTTGTDMNHWVYVQLADGTETEIIISASNQMDAIRKSENLIGKRYEKETVA